VRARTSSRQKRGRRGREARRRKGGGVVSLRLPPGPRNHASQEAGWGGAGGNGGRIAVPRPTPQIARQAGRRGRRTPRLSRSRQPSPSATVLRDSLSLLSRARARPDKAHVPCAPERSRRGVAHRDRDPGRLGRKLGARARRTAEAERKRWAHLPVVRSCVLVARAVLGGRSVQGGGSRSGEGRATNQGGMLCDKGSKHQPGAVRRGRNKRRASSGAPTRRRRRLSAVALASRRSAAQLCFGRRENTLQGPLSVYTETHATESIYLSRAGAREKVIIFNITRPPPPPPPPRPRPSPSPPPPRPPPPPHLQPPPSPPPRPAPRAPG
jgi:hypothetical protein